MPAQPITLSFPQLTDQVTAFASVAAWNSYFSAVTFTIDGTNIPAATGSTLGGVLEAVSAELVNGSTWTVQTYPASSYVTITAFDTGGNTYTTSVVTQTAFTQLLTNVNELKAGFDDLVNKLQAAGIML